MKRLIAIGLIAVMLLAVPAAAQASKDIYRVLQSDGSFNKLVSLIQATNQDRSLTVAGPFTILAPTDDAFNRMSNSSAKTLNNLTSNKFKRGSVVRNLMISGKYTTDQMASMGSVRTLDGRVLTVSKASNGSITVGGVRVVKPNIQARNGIVQGLDGVILPG